MSALLDVLDPDRLARGRDAPGEALADRDADPALDLLLETLGGARHQGLVVVLEQEDRRRVRVEDPHHAVEQLIEQVLER